MENDTLAKIFYNQTRKYGDRLALRYKDFGIWERVTWNQYYENVKYSGLGLKALGFKERDTLNILSEDRPEWLYADLGCICLRGISVGIYPTNAPFEIEYIAGHSDCKMIVVEDEEQLDKVMEVRDKLPKLEKIIIIELRNIKNKLNDPMLIPFEKVLEMGKELDAKEPGLFEMAIESTQHEDVCIMVYTSGTTGMPKAAMQAHDNIIYAVNNMKNTLGLTDTDEVLCYLPLCHVAERILSFFEAIIAGYTVNFAESIDTVNENLKEICPTYVFCPPRIWEKFHSQVSYDIQDATWFKRKIYSRSVKAGYRYSNLVDNHQPVPLLLKLEHLLHKSWVFRKLKDRLGLKKARMILTGAAPTSPEIIKYFHAIDCNMKEGYGQTESCGMGTLQLSGRVNIGTVGEVVKGSEMKIMEDGEILIRGKNNFKGYYKDPELTAETLDQQGWLHTGDVGEFDEDGFLKITDRKKDIIITAGGKNISPQMIESLLKFSPYVSDAIVIGDKRKYLTAMIMIDEENCAKYATANRIPFSTYENLAGNEEILKMIKKQVEEVNTKLAQVESIKKFRTFKRMLKEEDDDLTPTMKIRRKIVMDKFKQEIDEMYTIKTRDMIVN
ncbi:AMP-dependent synthetase/ligase [Thermodesulfobacteriota bacterium]